MNLARLVDHRITLVDNESDARYFGWVEQVSGTTITVRSLMPGPARGSRLTCRVASQHGTATFDALSVQTLGTEFVVNLEGKLSLSQLHEDPRYRIDLDAVVDVGGVETNVQVRDVSVRGVGFNAPRGFELGAATVVMFPSFSHLRVEGTIIHSAPQEGSHMHQVGVRLGRMDRIGRARWRRLIQMGDPILSTVQIDVLNAAA